MEGEDSSPLLVDGQRASRRSRQSRQEFETAFRVTSRDRVGRVPRICLLMGISGLAALYVNFALLRMFDFDDSIIVPITIWISVSAFFGALYEWYANHD